MSFYWKHHKALHLTTGAFWHNNILWARVINSVRVSINDLTARVHGFFNPLITITNPCYRAIKVP